MPSNAEAGVRRNDLYFARETFDAQGNPQTPANPTWLLYSTVFDSADQDSDANWEERTGIGHVVPQQKYRRQESHSHTVSYDLQQFPVDGASNPQDAVADSVLRDVDNRVEATHSILRVEKKADILSSNTIHQKWITDGPGTHPGTDPGAVSTGTRLTLYGRGGIPDEPELSVDPSDTAVVGVELPYTLHKLREYQIDQPTTARTLFVRSTDATDTTQSVQLEGVGGTPAAETVTLNGTTPVATVGTYGSLGQVRLGAETNGTVEVYLSNGDATTPAPGVLLTIIHGQTHYDGVEGDLGIPILGTGSFQDPAALGAGQAELTSGTSLTWDGSPAAEKVQGTTISVSNELEETNTDAGLSMDIRATSQEVTASSTVFGETETHDKLGDHLEGKEGELRVNLNGGDIVIPRAYIRDAISASREESQAFVSPDVTFSALEPADGSDPLQFVPNPP